MELVALPVLNNHTFVIHWPLPIICLQQANVPQQPPIMCLPGSVPWRLAAGTIGLHWLAASIQTHQPQTMFWIELRLIFQ
jgi:hypothetical protein